MYIKLKILIFIFYFYIKKISFFNLLLSFIGGDIEGLHGILETGAFTCFSTSLAGCSDVEHADTVVVKPTIRAPSSFFIKTS